MCSQKTKKEINQMIKNPNKSQKEVPVTPEEHKYKKKSQSKGQPRSKHKHEYETVLLNKFYHHTDYKTGRDKVTDIQMPFKVCIVCGRIDRFDNDESYYLHKPVTVLPFRVYENELSDKALALPQWYCDDYFDKFAKRMEDKTNE